MATVEEKIEAFKALPLADKRAKVIAWAKRKGYDRDDFTLGRVCKFVYQLYMVRASFELGGQNIEHWRYHRDKISSFSKNDLIDYFVDELGNMFLEDDD